MLQNFGQVKAANTLTLEEVCAKLPCTCSLSIWDGRPSCSNGSDAEPIRTQANTFLEAALLMLAAIEIDK